MRIWWSKEERVRRAAASWIARLNGPDASQLQTEFQAWHSRDPRHATAFARQQAIWSLAARAHPVSAPRTLPSPRLAYVTATALAATALVAFGMNREIFFAGDAMAIASSTAGIRTEQLSDGSRITLDTDSRVEVSIAARSRRVRLTQGRARFDVRPSADRPFIVTAGAAQFIAQDTRFDVALVQETPVVTLLRGTIEIRRAHAGSFRKAVLDLAPGEIVPVTASSPPKGPRAATQTELNWPSGMLTFVDEPLDQVLLAANRAGMTAITLDLAGGPMPRVTGTYQAGDNRRFAQTLGRMLGFEVRSRSDGSISLSGPSRK